MQAKKVSFVIIALCMLKLGAQQHQVFNYPQTYYQRGVELFDEKKYNAAILQLQLFLESSTDIGLRSEAEYYLAMSKLFAEHSDGETAVQNFLEKNPGSHKVHMANFALGNYWFAKGRYRTALGYYKQVDKLAIGPLDRDKLAFRHGYCLVAIKKYKEAVEILYPLTQKENQYQLYAKYYYGYCAYITGNYKEALRVFNDIKDEGPKSIKLYLAQIYYLMGDYEKSLSALKNAEDAAPASILSMLKGKNLYRQGKFTDAADAFNRAKIRPDSLDRNEIYEIGYANYKLKNYTKASEWLKKVSFLGDSLGQFASYNLGDCYIQLNQKRDAASAFSEAYRVDFNQKVAEDALFNHAKLATELGDNMAASLLQKYIDKYPNGAKAKEARKILAKLMLNTDNYRDAVAVLESDENMDESTAEIYQKVTLARGMELFKNRQFNESISMFDKSLTKKINNKITAQAYFWKAEAQMQQTEYGAADKTYNKFFDANASEDLDEHPLSYYGMGYSKLKQGEHAAAIPYFESYIKNASKSMYNEEAFIDAYCRLGDCYLLKTEDEGISKRERSECYDKAAKAYSYVSGRKNKYTEYALFQSAMIYGGNGADGKAKKISTLKRIISDYPKSVYLPNVYFELGRENQIAGNTKESEKNYMYVIDNYSKDQLVPSCYFNLGRLYYNANQDDKAIQVLTKLYKEHPNTDEGKAAPEFVKNIYTENGRGNEYIQWAAQNGIKTTSSEKDEYLYNDAITLYNDEKYKDAIKKFDYYIKEVPNGKNIVNAHYNKALCHKILKENDAALAEFKYLADLKGNKYQEDAIMEVLNVMGKNPDCNVLIGYMESIEEISKIKDRVLKAQVSNLRCYYKLNKPEECKSKALKILDNLGATNENKAEALTYLGKLEMDAGNYIAAQKHFNECISKYSNNKYYAESKYNLALSYYKLGENDKAYDECINFINNLNSYDYFLGKSYNLLGDVYLKKGDEFNAKATWNDVVAGFADIPEIYNEAKEKLEKLKNKAGSNNIIQD